MLASKMSTLSKSGCRAEVHRSKSWAALAVKARSCAVASRSVLCTTTSMPRHASRNPSIIILEACLSPVIMPEKAPALGLPLAWDTARDCTSSAIDLSATRPTMSGPAGARPGGTGGVALGFGIMSHPASPGGAVGLVGTRLGDVVSALETVGVTVACGLVLSGVLGMAGLIAGAVGGAGLLPASPSSPGVVVAFSLAPEASIGCGVGVDGVEAGTPGGSSPDSIQAGLAGGWISSSG